MSYLDLAKSALAHLRDPEERPRASRPAASEVVAASPGPSLDTGSVPTPEDVGAMTLSEFAQAGLIVRLGTAEPWGTDVLIVSDDVPEDTAREPGLPVYRAVELRKIHFLKPRPHEMRLLNEVKALFRQTIVGVEVGGTRR